MLEPLAVEYGCNSILTVLYERRLSNYGVRLLFGDGVLSVAWFDERGNMRGQIVVCKDVIGSPLVRMVWEDSDALVFVHTEDQFKARQVGLPHLEAVGFPVEVVFRYDSAALEASEPWELLLPYAEPQREHLDLLRPAHNSL
jgi:hypothetical protein